MIDLGEKRMKKTICSLLLAGLITPVVVRAQGTTYLSNLGNTSAGSVAIGSDAWIATPFFTGPNSSGYFLNSVQLRMGSASGSPSGFSVLVYNNTGRIPARGIGSLSGAEPTPGGTFIYTGSGMSLAPATLYFVVVTASTPIALGSYSWSYGNTTAYNSSDNWFMGPDYYTSTDGSSWTSHLIQANPFQFALNATAVPEPSSVALLCLGGPFLVARLLRSAKSKKDALS